MFGLRYTYYDLFSMLPIPLPIDIFTALLLLLLLLLWPNNALNPGQVVRHPGVDPRWILPTAEPSEGRHPHHVADARFIRTAHAQRAARITLRRRNQIFC
jgi:hypothetical protein